MIYTRASKIFAKEKGSHAGKSFSPAIKTDENNHEYVIYVAVPGMQRKDFHVRIQKKSLLVSADKKEGIHSLAAKRESDHPHWAKKFKLPEDADTIMTAAVYRNGELQIHIPKGEKELHHPSAGEVFVY